VESPPDSLSKRGTQLGQWRSADSSPQQRQQQNRVLELRSADFSPQQRQQHNRLPELRSADFSPQQRQQQNRVPELPERGFQSLSLPTSSREFSQRN
jgi:hypothetical protein